MLRRVIVLLLFAQIGFAAPVNAGGGGCGEPVSSRRTTEVRMKWACFESTIAHVRKGAEVTWVNRDHDRHNVVGANYLWGSPTMRFGDTVTYRFNEKGTYPYVCQYHPSMVGAIVVGNGKADEAIGWRDKAVKHVDFDRAGPGAIPSGGNDAGPPSGGAQVDLAPTSGSGEALPVEWVVLASSAFVILVLAVVSARRRGTSLARPGWSRSA